MGLLFFYLSSFRGNVLELGTPDTIGKGLALVQPVMATGEGSQAKPQSQARNSCNKT